MSTMDYLEFKEHLEHAFTQADRSKEYKKQSQESINRAKQSQALISKLADINAKSSAVLSDMNEIKNTKAGDEAYFHTRFYRKLENHGYKSGVGNAEEVTRKIAVKNTAAHASANSGLKSLRDSLASFLKSASASTIDPYKLTLIKKYYDTISKHINDEIGHVNKTNEVYQAVSGLSKLTSTVSHSSLEHAVKERNHTGMPSEIWNAGKSGMKKKADENAFKYSKTLQSAMKLGRNLVDIADRYHTDKIDAQTATSLAIGNLNSFGYANSGMNDAGRKANGGIVGHGGNELHMLQTLWKKGGMSDADTRKALTLIYELDTGTKRLSQGSRAGMPSNVKHSSLEHGWLSDLFKQKTESKGSTAGMPSNIPVNKGGSAVAAMNSYTDQLTRLTNSLYQYELQMKQYEEAYDQAKTAYANAKKEISRIEKLRETAIKNAKYPITDTSVSKLKENKAANNRYLAGKTTGSTAGMPDYLRRK